MHAILRNRGWIYARCLRLPKSAAQAISYCRRSRDLRFGSPVGRQTAGVLRQTHSASIEVASRPTIDPLAFPQNAQDRRHDEEALQKIFDFPAFWRDFASRDAQSVRRSGLLGIQYLNRPEGFVQFVEITKKQCQILVARILAASTVEDYRKTAKHMDRLSDLLCRVIDVSDFVRVFHRDVAMVKAATQAYERMFEYMNVLNTTPGLNEQLKKALSIPEVRSTWSQEEIITAETLIKDFAHSAVDQSPEHRQRFIDLSNDVSQLGTDFMSQVEPANEYVAIKTEAVREMNQVGTAAQPSGKRNLLRDISSKGAAWSQAWSQSMVPINSQEARQIAKLSAHDEARRDLYVATRTSSKTQVQRLQQLLHKRAELARLTGFSDYAQMTLSHKSALAKTPQGVNSFLKSLNASNRAQLKPTIDALLAEKTRSTGNGSVLQPWDIPFLQNRLSSRTVSPPNPYPSLDSFFSIGTVISGLSRLFDRLYGIRFVPRPTIPGEVWNPDVRRLDVISDTEGHIAVIYCDLFARVGKQPNPAHFTLRCSREITAEEIQDATPEAPINDGMPSGTTISSISGAPTLHQLPVIALVCDFDEPSPHKNEPTLLTPQNLTTLFHEMGHALHSILGRTSLQTIAGTRCAADFAEFPSILMEYFAMDPTVLKLFARHWSTGAVISDVQIQALHSTHGPTASPASALWHNETQILMSLLDQALHSLPPSPHPPDSSAIYHSVWNAHGSLAEPQGTSWQGFFGHLYGYGATYYSYLFDRAIARQVWRVVFEDGRGGRGLDREAGERLRGEVLRWGGGRDPWVCLEGLVGGGRGVLGEGGDGAMQEVGSWGVGAGREGGL